jgi:hypothetical protein
MKWRRSVPWSEISFLQTKYRNERKFQVEKCLIWTTGLDRIDRTVAVYLLFYRCSRNNGRLCQRTKLALSNSACQKFIDFSGCLSPFWAGLHGSLVIWQCQKWKCDQTNGKTDRILALDLEYPTKKVNATSKILCTQMETFWMNLRKWRDGEFEWNLCLFWRPNIREAICRFAELNENDFMTEKQLNRKNQRSEQ